MAQLLTAIGDWRLVVYEVGSVATEAADLYG